MSSIYQQDIRVSEGGSMSKVGYTRTVKDLPETPKTFKVANFFNFGLVICAFATFFQALRDKINTMALQLHTYRKVMAAKDGSSPTMVRIFKTTVVLCGKAATDFLQLENNWLIKKVDKVFPFNVQHQPYVKSAGGGIMFTAIEKKDWDLLISRHPLKDDAFVAKWLPGCVKYITKKANEIISKQADPNSEPTDAQTYTQRMLFTIWRYLQVGEIDKDLPLGFYNYEDFVHGGAAVDSAVGATCCPYLSSLGIYSCTSWGVKKFELEAMAINEWISKYKSNTAFRNSRSWTMLGMMCDDPKYSEYVKKNSAWNETGHKSGYGLELATQFISDLYGGVFSGGSVIVSVLEGLHTQPGFVLSLLADLKACGAADFDSVSFENINKSRELLRCICEGLRRRFPVPLLSRIVADNGVIIDDTSLPKGTRVLVIPRGDMYDPRYGANPDEYDATRWSDGLLDSLGSHWEEGVAGFIPFGHGPRRCNGRKLAMLTMQCVIARFVVSSQYVFSQKIGESYDNEVWFYGTAGFKDIKMDVSLTYHTKAEAMQLQNGSTERKEEDGEGMGTYAGAMKLALDKGKPAFDMNDVKIPEKDFMSSTPQVDVIKVENTTIELNSNDSAHPKFVDELKEAVAEAAFKLLSNSCFDEDAGDSFSSPLEELSWVKATYPEVMSNYNLTAGGHYWFGTHSDIGTARMFTHGLGASLITNCGDHLEVDLLFLENYKMRTNIEPQGCLAKFTLSGDLISIMKGGVTFTPSDGQGWQKAKLALRSTTIIFITLKDHLTWIHMRVSNTTLLCMRRTLEKDHPICRFLQPFLFNTCEINQGAKLTLIPIGSLAHRLSGMTSESFHKAFSDVYESWIFETFPESIARKNMNSVSPDVFPWATEGCAFWDVLHKFISDFITLYYPTEADFSKDDQACTFCRHMHRILKAPDNLLKSQPTRDACVNLLTLHVFYVSGGHTYAGGQLAYYLQTPQFVPPTLRTWNKQDKTTPWETLLPPKTMMKTTWTLVAMTQGKNPMLRQDFGDLFVSMPKEKEMRQLIKDFIGPRLQAVADEMDARNTTRQWPLTMFHPDLQASSVSV